MTDKPDSPLRPYQRYAWLVALTATVAVYLWVSVGAPPFLDGPDARLLEQPASRLAWILALPFALLTVVALVRSILDHRRFSRQVRRVALQDMTWPQLEALLREMYGRRGYSVVETPRRASGGFDYLLARDRERWLVQCRHWNARRVRSRVVRELAGLVAARGADGGIVVTKGRFTPPAQASAATGRIELIDGARLAGELLHLAEAAGLEHLRPDRGERSVPGAPPACPECGGDMIKRVDRGDDGEESPFWGCARYPDCPGAAPVEPAVPREGSSS